MRGRASGAAQQQDTSSFALGGGLDLVTPAIRISPGVCIAALNHEPRPEGYRRCDGFERFDGQPSPSSQSYWLISFASGSTQVTAGQTVTGGTSGATGIAVIAGILASGSYGGGNAAGTLVLRQVSGTFQNAEALKVSGSTVATSSSTAAARGASNDTNDQTYLQDAIEQARGLIQPVPGSGSILGVWYYSGVCYAFRNNVGATAAVMYKSTASGWSAVSLGRYIRFTAGSGVGFAEGNTVTGGTSGATAVIKRIGLTAGTYSGNNAVGHLVFTSVTGAFINNEALKVGGVTIATSNGADTAITLLPSGTYEFINYNFYGATNLKRMYGCDGVNPAFEFDGTVFAPIFTGMAVDTPNHIQENYEHLFLSFPGGSLQNSGIGTPLVWTVITGADEIGMGDDVTAMISNFSGIMVVYAKNKTSILYGTDSSSWQLKDLSIVDGCFPGSAQLLLQPTTYNNFGIRVLDTIIPTVANFAPRTITTQIKPLIDGYNAAKTIPTASIRVRTKSQYRLFFGDGTGILLDLSTPGQGGALNQFFPINYGKTVRCTCSEKDPNGNEVLFFGSDDGYVYQLDSGTSFDGQPVNAYLRLAFYNLKSPTQFKRWHKASVQLQTAAINSAIYCSADFSDGDPDYPSQGQITADVAAGGGFWDVATWDQFYWSSRVIGLASCRIEGEGTSISLAIASSMTYQAPYVASGVTFHWTPRRLQR